MKPWIPDILPLAVLEADRLITPLGEATAALSQYSGLLGGMVNAEVMLSPLSTQEAVLSSRIEGTQATIGDVLESDAGEQFDDAKNDDVEEVLNYRAAMQHASEAVKDRPITLQLVRSLHKVLMEGVRGQDKAPGTFRTEQNWIGPQGCTLENANFVPPNPMILAEHLEGWERYVAGEDIDPLIQVAVMHGQFEIIHPFIDGNGRIGRLLISLFLYCKGRIHAPTFYLSSYLESHRDEYYERLRAITERGEWNEWVIFFLRAVTEQANQNIKIAKGIYELYQEMKVKIRDATHSQHSALIVDVLFQSPIFRTSRLQEGAAIPAASAHKVVQQLQAAEIVRCIRQGSGRRPSLFLFHGLLNLVEGRNVF